MRAKPPGEFLAKDEKLFLCSKRPRIPRFVGKGGKDATRPHANPVEGQIFGEFRQYTKWCGGLSLHTRGFADPTRASVM